MDAAHQATSSSSSSVRRSRKRHRPRGKKTGTLPGETSTRCLFCRREFPDQHSLNRHMQDTQTCPGSKLRGDESQLVIATISRQERVQRAIAKEAKDPDRTWQKKASHELRLSESLKRRALEDPAFAKQQEAKRVKRVRRQERKETQPARRAAWLRKKNGEDAADS